MPEVQNQANTELLSGISPGAVVDLQINTPTSPKRARTTYVGMDTPNGMIFSLPQGAKWAGIKDLLLPDTALVVRHVIEGDLGTVVAFKVAVLRVLHTPLPLILTTYPPHVEFQALREHKRGQPGIAVNVAYAEHPEADAIIVDISQSGCRLAVASSSAFALSDNNNQLTLSCQLDGNMISIDAQIRNHSAESAYWYYGLAFKDADENVSALLKRHSLFYD